MQIGKKAGVVVVQAQIIALDARQPNQCPGFNDNLALVSLVVGEDGCWRRSKKIDVVLKEFILVHLGQFDGCPTCGN